MDINHWLDDDELVEVWKSDIERGKNKSWWYGCTTGLIVGLITTMLFSYFGYNPF